MKKKNGFTLIELLAVIVILAIIALIAVPVIMNVLNKANKSAFKDTAYGLLSAGELYFAEQQLELNGMSADTEFTFPTEDIEIKGNVPSGTILKVNNKGETALAMTNGRYCVTKGYSDSDITITEEFTDCNIPGGASPNVPESGSSVKTLKDLVTTTSEVTSIASCTTDSTSCAAGTAFAIKVNNTDTYKFYVLNDENNVVTLIMASNVYEEGNEYSNVEWINQEHYEAAGGTKWDDWEDNNNYGPITALKRLKERTADWTNIEEYSYELNYGKGTYSGQYVQNVRARLPRLSDVTTEAIGCTKWVESCPNWLYEGLFGTGNDDSYDYWLSDADSDTPESARTITFGGTLDEANVNFDSNVRPVITLTK